jgi:starvation-inducible outer membrane lipoprotein
MKKIVITVLVVSTLALVGCKDKPSPQPVSGPKDTMAGRELQPSAAHGGASPAANPHVGMRPEEIPMGADHKGKVVSAINAAGYTYIEVEEKGKRLWVAVMEVTVKPGDEAEFPDSPPVENFQSKTLNRTFDKIILAPGIRINGKPGQMGAHPKTG